MKYVLKNRVYKIIAAFMDLVGGILFAPSKLFKKNIPEYPKNILIVRLDHIGDFVCTTPLFENVKKKFPQTKITLLINPASRDLASRNPNIDRIVTLSLPHLARGGRPSSIKEIFKVIKDIKNTDFEIGFDPRGDILSIFIMWLGAVKYRIGYGITGGEFLLNKIYEYDNSKHIIDRNLTLIESLGISKPDRTPRIYFNKKDEDYVSKLLTDFDIGGNVRAVILHPYAGTRSKEWPKESFQKLIDKIKNDNIKVLLVGSAKDREYYHNVLDFRGKLTLPQLAYLIKRTGFFIGLDSGPANMAAALNVPSIIICSGTNFPQLWIPNNPDIRFIYKNVECSPCGLKICRKQKHECMDSITVEEVFEIASADKMSFTTTGHN